MRTNMTTKVTMGLIGGIVLVAAGCTVSTSTGHHSLPVDGLPTIPAGGCEEVGGPSTLPGGATTSYSITDDVGDAMNIAVVDAQFGCSAASSDTAYRSVYGTVYASDIVPATSTYNLVIECANLAANCIPTVDYWDYD